MGELFKKLPLFLSISKNSSTFAVKINNEKKQI